MYNFACRFSSDILMMIKVNARNYQPVPLLLPQLSWILDVNISAHARILQDVTSHILRVKLLMKSKWQMSATWTYSKSNVMFFSVTVTMFSVTSCLFTGSSTRTKYQQIPNRWIIELWNTIVCNVKSSTKGAFGWQNLHLRFLNCGLYFMRNFNIDHLW